MAILLKCNALFLHVPKTGGTWIREVLKELDLIEIEFSHEHADMERTLHVGGHYPGNHLKLSLRYLSSFEKKISQAYKFCFLREPLAWYQSYWRFMKDSNWKDFNINRKSRFGLKADVWHPFQIIHTCIDPDFNVFMSNLIKTEPGFLVKMYNSYALKPYINFVGKQESLESDLIEVLQRCDSKVDVNRIKSLTKRNSSKAEMPQWDQGVKEEIIKLEYPIYKEYYKS